MSCTHPRATIRHDSGVQQVHDLVIVAVHAIERADRLQHLRRQHGVQLGVGVREHAVRSVPATPVVATRQVHAAAWVCGRLQAWMGCGTEARRSGVSGWPHALTGNPACWRTEPWRARVISRSPSNFPWQMRWLLIASAARSAFCLARPVKRGAGGRPNRRPRTSFVSSSCCALQGAYLVVSWC